MRRAELASVPWKNIYVYGAVGLKSDRFLVEVYDPDCKPMFYVNVNGTTIITDGEKWYEKCYGVVYGASSEAREVPTDPSMRGLIKEAIRAYVDGKGCHLSFNGRHMKIDNEMSPGQILLANALTTQMNGEKK